MTSYIPWEQLRATTRSLASTKEYAVFKACNVLFTKELAGRLEGKNIACFWLDLGAAATSIWRATPIFLKPLVKLIPMLIPENGSNTTLFCIESADQSQSGLYFDNCRPSQPTALASNLALAKYLWGYSEHACY